MILEANIPLLRGAGPAAFESRYQGERDLIYATRSFETVRRNLAVDIAGDYFDLQQARQQIANSTRTIDSLAKEVGRSRGRWRAGKIIQLEVQRAEQDRLFAINNRLSASNNTSRR